MTAVRLQGYGWWVAPGASLCLGASVSRANRQLFSAVGAAGQVKQKSRVRTRIEKSKSGQQSSQGQK